MQVPGPVNVRSVVVDVQLGEGGVSQVTPTQGDGDGELIITQLPFMQSHGTIGPHSVQPLPSKSPQVMAPSPLHCESPAVHSSWHIVPHTPFEHTCPCGHGDGCSQSLHESLSFWPQPSTAPGPAQRSAPVTHSSVQVAAHAPFEQ
jgi:hypothetical protein